VETELDDRLLAEKAKAGDETAFGELVKMYHHQIHALAFRYVNHAEDARELAQMVWIKAWTKLGSFQGKSRFFTWLYRIAVFVCIDYLRKRKRQGEVAFLDDMEPNRVIGSEPPPSVQSRPDRLAQKGEIQERFNEALESLSPEHRMTLVLREVEGHAYDEIAEIMKCRKGTVMSRLHYARQALQEKMKDLK